MPQIFQVLRCYKCTVFQVHQTRKDNKWVCKMCGEKQSVKRHYGLGTGKDCRIHVRKLNKLRGEKEGTQIIYSDESDNDDDIENWNQSISNTSNIRVSNSKKESKWTMFIDKTEEKLEDNESEYYNDREVVLEIPQKSKNISFRQSKYSKKSIQNKVHSQNDFYKNDEIDMTSITKVNTNNNVLNVRTHHNVIILEQQAVYINSKIESQKNWEESQNKNNKFQSEIVNKESKWAQFVNNGTLQDESRLIDNDVHRKCNNNSLFSLCDDKDIDTILDY